MSAAAESRRQLVLRSDDAVPVAIAAFRDFARQHELTPKLINDFCIILDELVSNIIRYGYRGRADAAVELTLSLTNGTMEVDLVDDAPAFNMLETPDPELDRPVADRAIGGLGIYLVKRLSDEVTYDRDSGRNRLVIRKKI